MTDWYRRYLQGAWWRRRRASIIARADQRCEWCWRYCGPFVTSEDDDEYAEAEHEENRQRLEVHHLTYARVGRELDADLVAICESCHDGITERESFRRMVCAANPDVPRDADHVTVLIEGFRLQMKVIGCELAVTAVKAGDA